MMIIIIVIWIIDSAPLFPVSGINLDLIWTFKIMINS